MRVVWVLPVGVLEGGLASVLRREWQPSATPEPAQTGPGSVPAIEARPPAVSHRRGCCLPFTVIMSTSQSAVETATAGACLLTGVNRSVKVASGAGHETPASAAVGGGGRPLRNAASRAVTAVEVNVRGHLVRPGGELRAESVRCWRVVVSFAQVVDRVQQARHAV